MNAVARAQLTFQMLTLLKKYQTLNVRRALVSNKIFGHSDVVGA